MFCVECGTEGETHDGLCLDCVRERRTLVGLPRFLDVPRCKRCGSFGRAGAWEHTELDEALRGAVEASTGTDGLVSEWSVTAMSVEPEDETNFRLRVEFAIMLGGALVSEETRTKARLKAAVCPSCSRQAGGYYEAILQVRGDGRDLSEAELAAARGLVDEALGSKSESFVSREEEVHGGVDFYLSSDGLAKRVASNVQKVFGGQVSSSSSLHGRKDGRDVYRMTYLARLPGYAAGDVLMYEGATVQVASVGGNVGLVDLATGERTLVPATSMAGVVPLGAVRAKAVIVSREGEEVQVMDPETYRTITLVAVSPLPEGLEEVPVIRLGGDLYVDVVALDAGE